MRLLLTILLVAATGCVPRLPVVRDVSPDLASDEADANGEPSEEGPGLSGRFASVPEALTGPGLSAVMDGAPAQPADAAGDAAPLETRPPPPGLRDWLSPRALTSEGSQGRAAWSTDGSQIVFESTRAGGLVDNPWPQVWLMDADGSRQRRVSMGIGRADRPAFAGGGRALAYGSTHHAGVTEPLQGARERAAEAELYRQDLDTGSVERLTEQPGFDGDAAWCADGSLAIFASERGGGLDLYALRPDAAGASQLSGEAGDEHSPTLDAACRRAAWVREVDGGSELHAGLVSGRESSLLLARAARIEDPAFAGDRLLFASDLQEPGGALELYSLGPDGDLRRLTVSAGDERHPAPSPDGAWLLYTDDRSGSAQLVISPLDPSWGSPVGSP